MTLAGRAVRASTQQGIQTVSIIRVGSTKQYAEGWEAAFAKGKKKASSAVKSVKATAKKATKAVKSAAKTTKKKVKKKK
jgi:hypothetical protein